MTKCSSFRLRSGTPYRSAQGRLSRLHDAGRRARRADRTDQRQPSARVGHTVMLRRFRSRAQSLASVCALVASVWANAVEVSTHAHTSSESAPAYVEHDASAHRSDVTDRPPRRPSRRVWSANGPARGGHLLPASLPMRLPSTRYGGRSLTASWHCRGRGPHSPHFAGRPL